MKKVVLFAAILTGAILAIFLARSRPLPEEAAAPPMEARAPIAHLEARKATAPRSVNAPTTTFHPMPFVPSLPGRPNPFAAVPTDNILTFVVQPDGLAVAFGDVILGRTESGGVSGQRGRFDTPVPQLWDKPEIPYSIAPDLVNPSRVEQAIAYYRDHTPIRLVPYNGQPDAIVFETGDDNCMSSLGRVGGLQPVKLSPKCGPPQIVHEIMHALGFVHEQSRPDRNQFVQIQWDNIEEKYQEQFAMVSEAFTEAMRGSSFDYHSAMLYRPDIFAMSPVQPTMRPTGTEAITPVNEGLSVEDIRRLNQLYGQ